MNDRESKLDNQVILKEDAGLQEGCMYTIQPQLQEREVLICGLIKHKIHNCVWCNEGYYSATLCQISVVLHSP